MSETEHASSMGQTGGLPGANADPRTAQVPPEDLVDRAAMADVADQDGATDEAEGVAESSDPDS